MPDARPRAVDMGVLFLYAMRWERVRKRTCTLASQTFHVHWRYAVLQQVINVSSQRTSIGVQTGRRQHAVTVLCMRFVFLRATERSRVSAGKHDSHNVHACVRWPAPLDGGNQTRYLRCAE